MNDPFHNWFNCYTAESRAKNPRFKVMWFKLMQHFKEQMDNESRSDSV